MADLNVEFQGKRHKRSIAQSDVPVVESMLNQWFAKVDGPTNPDPKPDPGPTDPPKPPDVIIPRGRIMDGAILQKQLDEYTESISGDTREGFFKPNIPDSVNYIDLEEPLLWRCQGYWNRPDIVFNCVGDKWHPGEWAMIFDPKRAKSDLLRLSRRDYFLQGIRIRCNFKCRGFFLNRVDRSVIDFPTIEHSYGCAIGMTDAREIHFRDVNIHACMKYANDAYFDYQVSDPVYIAKDGSNNCRMFGLQVLQCETGPYLRCSTSDNREPGNSNPTRGLDCYSFLLHKPVDNFVEDVTSGKIDVPWTPNDKDPNQRMIEIKGANAINFWGGRFRVSDNPEASSVLVESGYGYNSSVLFSDCVVIGKLEDSNKKIPFIDKRSNKSAITLRNIQYQGQTEAGI